MKNIAVLFAAVALSAGCSHKKSEQTYQWPNTSAENSPFERMGDGVTQYKKVEVAKGKWQWVEDEEAMESIRKDERHKADLWYALRNRVLTKQELIEVAQYGTSLNTPIGMPYSASEKAQELQDALTAQGLLQQLSSREGRRK